jgi:hypothetical protein
MLLPDYLYYKNTKGWTLSNDKNIGKEWFDMKSITKMFLLFVLIDLKIKSRSRVTKYLPNYPHKNIKIIDIINHTSGLQNDWGGSELQKNYFRSKNIYQFTLKLDQIPENYGKFMYNNYAYNILALIVKKVTKKHWHEYLPKLFPGAKFQIHKQRGIPFAAHSLFIRKSDIPIISKIVVAKKYHALISKKKLMPRIQKHYQEIFPGWSGHSGSGGQDLMFNDKQILWILSYDNPDLHKRGLSDDQIKNIVSDIIRFEHDYPTTR